jgi:hypothetical protein
VLRSGALDHADRHNQLGITAFGRAFVKACRAPDASDPPVRWTDREALHAAISEREAKEAAAKAQAEAASTPVNRDEVG